VSCLAVYAFHHVFLLQSGISMRRNAMDREAEGQVEPGHGADSRVRSCSIGPACSCRCKLRLAQAAAHRCTSLASLPHICGRCKVTWAMCCECCKQETCWACKSELWR
jgi:hypothetical protein